jgi:adenylate kinase
MSDVIFLTGIPGVGKTTLAERVASKVPFEYLSAGSLIASALVGVDQEPSRDELRDARVLDNQKLLLEGFRQARKTAAGPIVLDGHVIVRNASELIVIPEAVFQELGCCHFLAVTNDPAQIAANRLGDSSRSRQLLTIQQIGEDQAVMLARVNELGLHLERPVTEVRLSDYGAAIQTFEGVVLNPRRPCVGQQ